MIWINMIVMIAWMKPVEREDRVWKMSIENVGQDS